MSCLSITELPRAERQDIAIKEAVRAWSQVSGVCAWRPGWPGMNANIHPNPLDHLNALLAERREFVEQINRMHDDYDLACDDAFELAQKLRKALDLINEACRMLYPHASVQIENPQQQPKKKRGSA